MWYDCVVWLVSQEPGLQTIVNRIKCRLVKIQTFLDWTRTTVILKTNSIKAGRFCRKFKNVSIKHRKEIGNIQVGQGLVVCASPHWTLTLTGEKREDFFSIKDMMIFA